MSAYNEKEYTTHDGVILVTRTQTAEEIAICACSGCYYYFSNRDNYGCPKPKDAPSCCGCSREDGRTIIFVKKDK